MTGLREVRGAFDAFKSRWYAEYHAHPLWDRLRTGEATRNELVAWMIHKYQVSRSAGVVGARLASTVRDPSWQRVFSHDTLDEYWHCDEYDFVRHPSLSLSPDEVKAYVPLPATLAFEVHALQTAERSPLAHLLVAEFQKSSVRFEPDCGRFYRDVASAYDLPGLFNGWERHIRIDQEHGHAKILASLFDTTRHVGPDELHAALRDAWLAHFFLLRSLDDIEDEWLPGDRIRLRLPLENVPAGAEEVSPQLGTDRTTAADCNRLTRALARASFRCLGHARAHDDIIAVGQLADALARVEGREVDAAAAPRYDSPWAAACASQLGESAMNVREFLTAARLAATALAHTGSAAMSEAARVAHAALGGCGASTPQKDQTRLMTHALQTVELLERWWSSDERVPEHALAL